MDATRVRRMKDGLRNRWYAYWRSYRFGRRFGTLADFEVHETMQRFAGAGSVFEKPRCATSWHERCTCSHSPDC